MERHILLQKIRTQCQKLNELAEKASAEIIKLEQELRENGVRFPVLDGVPFTWPGVSEEKETGIIIFDKTKDGYVFLLVQNGDQKGRLIDMKREIRIASLEVLDLLLAKILEIVEAHTTQK